MLSKNLIYILLIIISVSNNVLGQKRMVIAQSGVNVRAKPTAKSKALCSLKFGSVVNTLENNYSLKDTIDDMRGFWAKIKSGQCVGYVFSPFLSMDILKHNSNFPTNHPQFFKLRSHCGDQRFFNPELNWYCILEKEKTYQIVKADYEFSVESEHFNEETHSYLKVKIHNASEVEFLIGLPDSVPNYEIYKTGFFLSQSHLKKNQRRFLIYPGQSHYIGNREAHKRRESYHIDAVGNVKTNDLEKNNNSYSSPLFNTENYNIRIIQKKDQVIKVMNLFTEDKNNIVAQGEGLPTIVFIGDLNYDHIPEIIVRYNTHYSESRTEMYMSGFSEENFLTKVFEKYWGGCY